MFLYLLVVIDVCEEGLGKMNIQLIHRIKKITLKKKNILQNQKRNSNNITTTYQLKNQTIFLLDNRQTRNHTTLVNKTVERSKGWALQHRNQRII